MRLLLLGLKDIRHCKILLSFRKWRVALSTSRSSTRELVEPRTTIVGKSLRSVLKFSWRDDLLV